MLGNIRRHLEIHRAEENIDEWEEFLDSFPSEEETFSGFDNTLSKIVNLSIEMNKLTPTEKWEAQESPFNEEDYAHMVLARNIKMTPGMRDKLLRSHNQKVR